ncbi:MAG TPA: transglycosylase SLT domain-containing protein [Gammaproteobacteria bacterium]|nr:transglycosylase SLT domain-containing protein [Gammaproteobacteria bacterium]
MRPRIGNRLLAGAALLMASAPAAAQPAKYGNQSADDLDPALRSALVEAIAAADSFEDRFDAEVWLTDMSQRLGAKVPNVEERLHILRTVHRHATAADLDPELVLAVIDVESNFDRFAISSANALGLMQVMPFWVEEVGETDMNLLFDIEFNILLGCRILKYYLDMEDGELMQALARYNGSTGRRWYGDRVLDRLRLTWFRN